MNAKDNALDSVRVAHELLNGAQKQVKGEQTNFAKVCRSAHEDGVSDREMAEVTDYSRARIQQFRCGDPRKK